jgi:tRNA nucleotidyltransferase (CCA-adding enzyme)
MKRYLVGGAVRDALLGVPVSERDWVVVGATPEDMTAQGYRAVGADFPVFLHPQTQEEHALARTERKSGRGYHGFQFHTGPEVTLGEDLSRRDLTINAMARDERGELVDPHGGRRDLEAKLLRHVSPAFAEDPVRVLRVARFAARYAPLGFRLADETLALMRGMVDNGEVDELVPERVWKEAERALMESDRASAQGRPGVFFNVLHDCGALARVMPELARLSGVPQRADYHPEVDTLVHTLMCVDVAARDHRPLDVRVAALLHDLGKADTPREEWPSHRQHEQRGVRRVQEFCARLRVPASPRELAIVVTREHLLVHRVRELRPQTLLELLERLDAFRRPERFELALQACECDARGRLGFDHCEYPQTDYLRDAARAAVVSNAEIQAQGYSGPAFGKEVTRRRTEQLRLWKETLA